MVLAVTIAASSSLGAPLIVLLDAPYPFLALTFLLVVAFINSCFLPKKCPDEASEVEEEYMYADKWSETEKSWIIGNDDDFKRMPDSANTTITTSSQQKQGDGK